MKILPRLILTASALLGMGVLHAADPHTNGTQERAYWVQSLTKISDPVLKNLANNTLRKNMPVVARNKTRSPFAHLESFGRLVCGIAPWLELGPDNTPEGKLRKKYIDLTLKAIANAVDPESPDYMVFDKPSQPLVDTAFLIQGILRAPKQLLGNLDEKTRNNLIEAMKKTRKITPGQSNWLLFASMVEAGLQELTGECDSKRLMDGVVKFRDKWYYGDSIYGDGVKVHNDYYNSFVIHPMLTDILRVMDKHKMEGADFLNTQYKRLSRYAAIQERQISPEGTYPVVGRSITYRFGAFQALAQAALLNKLPSKVTPQQVRCALTSVMKRQMEAPNTFDKDGWLTIGFCGSQINMSEYYINTGSQYLCAAVFLPLGLAPDAPFWKEPCKDWTNRQAWSGVDIGADHADN
ncbi:DUF2264 domain-containing protein [Akkermansia sp. N21116]|nr:DUF2264 domain-containing protein [Akkermansia sp. N21116]WPX40747.1 DUF2264 domain-containing protein [Akkermansia sp. N21116]